MTFKSCILFLTFLVGSLAVPAVIPDVESNEDFFYHTETSARVVGGTPAASGSAPHMVALTTGGTWFRSFVCGGSLITTRTVLTAAHCIEAVYIAGFLISSLQGFVGTDVWHRGGVEIVFSHNITHEHYDGQIIKNDIGLLIARSPVALSQNIQLVPLSFEHIPGGIDARATGWGRTRAGGWLSDTLLELTMKTIEGDQCVRQIPAPHQVEPHIELCTIHEPDFGMCNGDSGSALVQVATGKQIGIVSWGIPCATAAPDMFVRVSAFRLAGSTHCLKIIEILR